MGYLTYIQKHIKIENVPKSKMENLIFKTFLEVKWVTRVKTPPRLLN